MWLVAFLSDFAIETFGLTKTFIVKRGFLISFLFKVCCFQQVIL